MKDDIDMCNAIIVKLFNLLGINGISVNKEEINNAEPLEVTVHPDEEDKNYIYIIQRQSKEEDWNERNNSIKSNK